jgi:hypothetical protein
LRQKLAECGYISPFGTIGCNANHINAYRHGPPP